MKLKYYMRGLGLGIILTTLILTIANPKEKLSNDEIKERAQALGMEMADNSDLDKALDKLELTGTPAPTPAPILTQTPTVIPTAKPTAEPTKEPVKVPTKAPAVTSVPSTSKTSQKISFTITGGMSSGKVAKLLVSKGIIKDADDFNQYIVKVGKAGIIRVGSYSISKDAAYDDIIKMITTKK